MKTKTNPPRRPSSVLLGLIFGAIAVFPKFEPKRYAKVSKIVVLIIIIKNHLSIQEKW